MSALNRSILAGRLIADPEIRYTSNEVAVANFALDINGKEGGERINCIAFGGLAKIVGEYLKKGKLVAIEGRLHTRLLEGKSKGSRLEVVVDNLQMLDSKFYQASKEDRSDKI